MRQEGDSSASGLDRRHRMAGCCVPAANPPIRISRCSMQAVSGAVETVKQAMSGVSGWSVECCAGGSGRPAAAAASSRALDGSCQATTPLHHSAARLGSHGRPPSSAGLPPLTASRPVARLLCLRLGNNFPSSKHASNTCRLAARPCWECCRSRSRR